MRKFGLIGYSADAFVLTAVFTEKFEREGIRDASYSVYPLQRIDELTGLFGDPALQGLNVTILIRSRSWLSWTIKMPSSGR